MAVTTIGLPFEGKAWYWVETSYGSGESTSTLPISRYIQSVQVSSGDRHTSIRSIDSPEVALLLEQTKEPKFHIEYQPQSDDTLMEDVINRDACGVLQSLAFNVGVNTCQTGDNLTWYLVKGAKPSSVKISGAKGAAYTVTVDFEAKSIATSTALTGAEPSALTGDILQFNTAGSITKSGGFNPTGSKIAYITNAIDITIDHKLTGYTDHDSVEKSYLVEGELGVTGTVGITLDGGGGMHFGEVLANTDFTIDILFDNVPNITLELGSCEWDNNTTDVNVDGNALIESAPFTGKTATIS